MCTSEAYYEDNSPAFASASRPGPTLFENQFKVLHIELTHLLIIYQKELPYTYKKLITSEIYFKNLSFSCIYSLVIFNKYIAYSKLDNFPRKRATLSF